MQDVVGFGRGAGGECHHVLVGALRPQPRHVAVKRVHIDHQRAGAVGIVGQRPAVAATAIDVMEQGDQLFGIGRIHAGEEHRGGFAHVVP